MPKKLDHITKGRFFGEELARDRVDARVVNIC